MAKKKSKAVAKKGKKSAAKKKGAKKIVRPAAKKRPVKKSPAKKTAPRKPARRPAPVMHPSGGPSLVVTQPMSHGIMESPATEPDMGSFSDPGASSAT